MGAGNIVNKICNKILVCYCSFLYIGKKEIVIKNLTFGRLLVKMISSEIISEKMVRKLLGDNNLLISDKILLSILIKEHVKKRVKIARLIKGKIPNIENYAYNFEDKKEELDRLIDQAIKELIKEKKITDLNIIKFLVIEDLLIKEHKIEKKIRNSVYFKSNFEIKRYYKELELLMESNNAKKQKEKKREKEEYTILEEYQQIRNIMENQLGNEGLFQLIESFNKGLFINNILPEKKKTSVIKKLTEIFLITKELIKIWKIMEWCIKVTICILILLLYLQIGEVGLVLEIKKILLEINYVNVGLEPVRNLIYFVMMLLLLIFLNFGIELVNKGVIIYILLLIIEWCIMIKIGYMSLVGQEVSNAMLTIIQEIGKDLTETSNMINIESYMNAVEIRRYIKGILWPILVVMSIFIHTIYFSKVNDIIQLKKYIHYSDTEHKWKNEVSQKYKNKILGIIKVK